MIESPDQTQNAEVQEQEASRRARAIANAGSNCRLFFGLFIIGGIYVVVKNVLLAAGIHLRTTSNAQEFDPLKVLNLLVGGSIGFGIIYAMIYLPLRWSTIKELPASERKRGLIGGLGLIGVAVADLLIALAIGQYTHDASTGEPNRPEAMPQPQVQAPTVNDKGQAQPDAARQVAGPAPQPAQPTVTTPRTVEGFLGTPRRPTAQSAQPTAATERTPEVALATPRRQAVQPQQPALVVKGFHLGMTMAEAKDVLKTKHNMDCKEVFAVTSEDGASEATEEEIEKSKADNEVGRKMVERGLIDHAIPVMEKGRLKGIRADGISLDVDDAQKVIGIRFSENAVDAMFNAKDMSAREFAQAFINGYKIPTLSASEESDEPVVPIFGKVRRTRQFYEYRSPAGFRIRIMFHGIVHAANGMTNSSDLKELRIEAITPEDARKFGD